MRTKNNKRMTKKSRKTICRKVNKFNKRRFSKKRAKRTKRTKGGYGKGACPFVGKPWNATGYAYYYPHSKDGISVGGVHPYSGNHSPSPQNGGNLFQPLINVMRLGEVGGENIVNRYKGKKLTPSPLPMLDQLKRRKY